MLNHSSPQPPQPPQLGLDTSRSLMARSITLADPITIRIGHRGVVGLTGRIINIGVDGAWSVSKFANSMTSPPSQSGQLSPYAIRLIEGVLNASHHGHTLASLPTHMGSSHINCPLASISSGKISRIAFIEVDSPRTPTYPAAKAFSDIVSKIQKIVGI